MQPRRNNGSGVAECRRPDINVYPPKPPPGPFFPDDPTFNHSFATWSLHPYSTEEKLKDEKQAWRVERYLGFDRGNETSATPPVALPNGVRADVVVLDDAGLGFRSTSDRWPTAIKGPSMDPPWIVVKMSRPVAEGRLWDNLVRERPSRLIAVTTVNDLRFSEVRISRDLSWERAAEDLAREIVKNPRIRSLTRCAATIVSFGPVGAFLLRGTGGVQGTRTDCELFFDPGAVEGAWSTRHPGAMIGYMSCLTSGVVRQLIMKPANPDFGLAIRSGLGAMRKLHIEGYGVRGAAARGGRSEVPDHGGRGGVGEGLRRLHQFTVPNLSDRTGPPVRPRNPAGAALQAVDPDWTILREKYDPDHQLDAEQYAALLEAVARRIVLDGHKERCAGYRSASLVALVTADRHEIESFSSIRSLIAEYWNSTSKSRPLCIAVFGTPGSGKSFGIEQVAVSVAARHGQEDHVQPVAV